MWHACRSVAAHALSMDPLVKGRDFVHRAMPVVVHKLVGDEVSREYNRGLWERRCQLERGCRIDAEARRSGQVQAPRAHEAGKVIKEAREAHRIEHDVRVVDRVQRVLLHTRLSTRHFQ